MRFNQKKVFENMVASQLLKFCHIMEDWEGYKMDLRYIRNREGKEVDFLVIQEGRPLFAVECKYHKTTLSPSLKYFREKLDEIPKFYQVHMSPDDYQVDNKVRVLPFATLCQELTLPLER